MARTGQRPGDRHLRADGGIGTLSGFVLNLVNHRYRQDELPWSDPIVWQSGGMFAWLLVAALFNAFYQAGAPGAQSRLSDGRQLRLPGDLSIAMSTDRLTADTPAA